ncbi:MAG: recombinase family protein [Planctomycetota bacterium]
MIAHKCGVYIRVSTPRQAAVDEGSLDMQEERLKDFVVFQNKNTGQPWELTELYREEGRSGKNVKRPEYQRMMADIMSGRINTVICAKIDRITRSLRDFYSLLEIMEQYGVQFISRSENFDTKTAMGRTMLKIILIFAELEREQTGERTSSVMDHRAHQGFWNGGQVLGYRLDPNKKGHIIPDPEYAPVVKNIFKLT